jgi:HSP20 family protein
VNTQDRKYHKNLELPCEVKPDSSKASYKNGVLEVRIRKAEVKKGEKRGFNVKID